MPHTASTLPAPLPAVLQALPKSWSALTWRQLCDVWQCKIRYGWNTDVARAAALLALCGLTPVGIPEYRNIGISSASYDEKTGEAVYTMQDGDGRLLTVTPRELSQLAQQALPWFGFPYGDPGKEAVKDENGKVVEEAVSPVRGYVNPDWRDAMALPEETIVVCGDRMLTGTEWQRTTDMERKKAARYDTPIHFALPQVACNNLTWQQYRSLQAIAPQLFQEGASDSEVLDWQAQFVAQMLVPASTTGDSTAGRGSLSDHFTPKQVFAYDADRAEQTVPFWRRLLSAMPDADATGTVALFHIVFQVYQTAMRYYEQVFPLLFNGGGKNDPLQDALTGETRTLNAVMKYQGYTKPEDVYAENLPVILSTLNTMAEEAKQIEQMNAKIRSKK